MLFYRFEAKIRYIRRNLLLLLQILLFITGLEFWLGKLKYSGVGVLRDIYFSPPLWLTKVKYIDFIYLRWISWQNWFIWSFSAYFYCSNPTEAATIRLWSARWRHFQPIRARLSRNPLSRNTPPPLYQNDALGVSSWRKSFEVI